MHLDKFKSFIYLVIILLLIVFIMPKILPMFKLIGMFLWKLTMPFLIASLISYLLYPLMLKLQTYKIKKVFAIIIIYVSFLTLSLMLIYKSLPIFIEQLEELSVQLPQVNTVYEDVIVSFYEATDFLPEMVHDKVDELLIKIEESAEIKIGNLLEKVTNIFDFIIILTIIPVLIFYFLKDYQLFTKWLLALIPNRYHQSVAGIFTAVNKSLGAYLRGQFILSLTITFITLIVYELLDLKYAFLLAVFIGLMNVIPYFGPIIGTIPAAIIAITMSWKVVLIVVIATILIQIIESSLLSPYIMGKSVAIHPVMIILILLIGAELAGIIGMVLAVPLVTISRAIFLQIKPLKQQSD